MKVKTFFWKSGGGVLGPGTPTDIGEKHLPPKMAKSRKTRSKAASGAIRGYFRPNSRISTPKQA